MNILAVDTSGPVAGVAILSDGRIAYEGAAVNRMTHSVNLMPMAEEALTRGGLSIEDIDLFAAVTGPGSFTGVRIGVSTVKGMAHGAGKPCIGIDALEALAAGVTGAGMGDVLLCPIQDARAGQVYGAVFTAGMPPVRRLDNQAAKLEVFVEQALAIKVALAIGEEASLCFLGDGVQPYREELKRLLGDQACFLPAHLSFLRPAGVAVLAELYAEQAGDYLTLQPKYLRAPQAERERAAKMKGTTELRGTAP